MFRFVFKVSEFLTDTAMFMISAVKFNAKVLILKFFVVFA